MNYEYDMFYLVFFSRPLVVWPLLCFMLLVIRVAIALCLASSFLFINNSVTFDKLGSVNGLGMSMTAVFRSLPPSIFLSLSPLPFPSLLSNEYSFYYRTVAPLFAGSIYSVSLTDGLSFPLNYHLIFIIFAIIILIVMVMVACLPKTINKQKVVPDGDSAAAEEEFVTQIHVDREPESKKRIK